MYNKIGMHHMQQLNFVDYQPAEPPFVVHFYLPINTEKMTLIQSFHGESILDRVEKTVFRMLCDNKTFH